jgi:hypothetical protein
MLAIDDPAQGFLLPQHRGDALSTDSASAGGFVLRARAPLADTGRTVAARS